MIGTFGTELPVDPVQRAWRLGVRDRGAHRLASTHALQALLAHQPFDGAARYHHTLAVELAPDLVGPVDLEVGLPYPLDLRHQAGIALRATRAQRLVALASSMAPIRRQGDLQNATDRLDPELLAMPVDKGLQDLMRRSSSAWAKNALASFRISLALRSSRTSRSSSFTRWATMVVTPSRTPASISARLTHSFSVCGTHPILGAMDSMAAHSDGYRNLGLAVKGIEIYFPLTPTHALAMWCRSISEGIIRSGEQLLMLRARAPEMLKDLQDGDRLERMASTLKMGAPLAYEPEHIENFNSLQISNAERYVFANGEHFDLARRMLSAHPHLSKGPRVKA